MRVLTTSSWMALGLILVAGCGAGGSNAPAKATASAAGEAPTAAAERAASGEVPDDFFGVVAPELLPAKQGALDQALDAQAKAGVNVIRQPFLWQEIEPKRGTYAWGMHDRLVGHAAKRGIAIMPIIFGVPKREASKRVKGVKVTATTTMPPRRPARFAAFAAALAKRYGTGGEFWKANPTIPARPIVEWQVWNEPNLPPYWGGKPNAAQYARLLVATAKALRAADANAVVITGGVPESRLGVPLQTFVRGMVRAGAAQSFDVLAVHPYAANADAVLRKTRQARDAAIRGGAKDPDVWITEFGWATGGPGGGFTVSESRQAQLISEVLRKAVAQRDSLHLRGLVYYAWRDVPVYPGGKDFWGLHTGLVRKNNKVKPSLSAWAAATKAARAGS